MITIAEGTSNTPTNQMVSDTRKQSILRMHATTTQKEETTRTRPRIFRNAILPCLGVVDFLDVE